MFIYSFLTRNLALFCQKGLQFREIFRFYVFFQKDKSNFQAFTT